MTKTLGITFLTMVGTATGDLIQNHTMDLKTVCAVGVIVLGGTWTISKRFTHLEDRINDVEKDIHDLPCEQRARKLCVEKEKE